MHSWGSRSPLPPLLGPLDPEVSLGGLKPDQIDIGNIHYNYCFIYSPSWWVTMAPEGHGAHVLPDPDVESKKVTCPH